MIIVHLALTSSAHLKHIAPSLGRHIDWRLELGCRFQFLGVLGDYHVRSY